MGFYVRNPDVSMPQCFGLIVPGLGAGDEKFHIEEWRENILLVVIFPSRCGLSFIILTPYS